MDRVFVTNLQVDAIIGVHPQERTTPQPLLISFELPTDGRRAAATDRLDDAVDYEDAARSIGELAREGRYQLIETLAEEIAALLLQRFGVSSVSVEVQKPNALSDAESVGIRIQRPA